MPKYKRIFGRLRKSEDEEGLDWGFTSEKIGFQVDGHAFYPSRTSDIPKDAFEREFKDTVRRSTHFAAVYSEPGCYIARFLKEDENDRFFDGVLSIFNQEPSADEIKKGEIENYSIIETYSRRTQFLGVTA